MTQISHIFLRGPARLAAAAILVACTGSAAFAASGRFPDAFLGNWTGTGTMTHQDGSAERIRCQAHYAAQGRDSLRQELNCQSDSTKFDLRTNVRYDGGRLTGQWNETSHNASGTLTGLADRNTIRAQVSGQGFGAGVGIAVRGNRQTVNIAARGADITKLHMSLIKQR